jgi:HK97 family phage portal protein
LNRKGGEKMGLFDFMKKRDNAEVQQTTNTNQNTNSTETIAMPNDLLLQALLNNEEITRENALTIPTVSGAVDFISNTIASMPIKLYKYKQGKVEEVEGDTRTKLLNGDTGDTLDAFQMKKAMIEDYLLGKGGYAYIRRNKNDVTGLFYVKDIRITAYPNFQPIFKDFYLIVEGETYQPYEFIKLLRATKDGATGRGLTCEVATALQTAYQTLTYQLGLVKTGGNKKGFIKSQNRLTQDAINSLKTAWANLYQNNTENVVVLNQGLEFQESSSSSVEMQLNQNKKTLADEINDIFHIHKNDFDLTFKEAIYPIVRAFETALNRDLLLEKEKKNMFFEFDVKEILRANTKERYEAYAIALKSGIKTINEIRKMENDNYIEGMDVLNFSLGTVLYDTNTHQYYTPNTDTISTFENETEEITDDTETTEEPLTINENISNLDEQATKELENAIKKGGDNNEN